MKDDYDRMRDALVALHEQAHGDTSMRMCQQDPCRGLFYSDYGQESTLQAIGPAPRTTGAF